LKREPGEVFHQRVVFRFTLQAMNLTINGEDREFESLSTLFDLLNQLGMKLDRIAVERNRELVPRDRWTATVLAEGDKLEIVQFVGGGS
jgi:thiazole synthase